jgi:ABC-type nitrate/sulfonate/bicarbonate transport system substrate-binding protein
MSVRLTWIVIVVVAAAVATLWTVWPTGRIKVEVIHTVSYSNAAVFLVIKDNPDEIQRRFVPDPGKHVEALLAGGASPSVSVTPFSNALIAMAQYPDLVIIGGSGLNGLSLISSFGPTLDALENKRIGTARGDSLELFVYEAMRPRRYIPVYFTDPFVLVTAAKARDIDAATHVEPFATELVNAGLVRVLTSRELWGSHPDAVLLTTRKIVSKYRPQLRWLLTRLLAEEMTIKKDPQSAAHALADFYRMPADQLLAILDKQEPKIDIRQYENFFAMRIKTLVELKYLTKPLAIEHLFDWSILEEAERLSK